MNSLTPESAAELDKWDEIVRRIDSYPAIICNYQACWPFLG